jgi:hypothetical protein
MTADHAKRKLNMRDPFTGQFTTPQKAKECSDWRERYMEKGLILKGAQAALKNANEELSQINEFWSSLLNETYRSMRRERIAAAFGLTILTAVDLSCLFGWW